MLTDGAAMLNIDFIKSPKLKKIYADIIHGTNPNMETALNAISMLKKEGESNLKSWVGTRFYETYFPTNRHGGHWRAGRPTGLVDHYTAGIDGSHTARWFSNRSRKGGAGNSSAHFIMERDGSLVVLVDPLTTIAYHATWANKDHIGIEHVNAGLLNRVEGELFFQETRPYPTNRADQVEKSRGSEWEMYTSAQVISNIVLKRLLIAAIPTLEKDHFVDHEIIDPARKRDCGPLWPMKDINDLVFSWKAFNKFESLIPTFMRKNVRAVFHEEVKNSL
jgi:N-acetyl-anhydromuramyl-L-alanine amidase AmpD